MKQLLLSDGTETDVFQMEKAFYAGLVRLVHSHADGKTSTSVRIDGVDIDTRGECHSVWDEVWTAEPKTLAEALRVARG